MELRLVVPNEALQACFARAHAAFRQEGLSWWLRGDIELAEKDFAAFVARKLADAHAPREGMVAATHWWALANDEMVGRISVRHALNDALRREGGHIGYDTVPAFRGKGVATELLRQALPLARSLGLCEVLLTCDATNAASIRVIEKNGGVLRETKSIASDRPPKRYYWIAL